MAKSRRRVTLGGENEETGGVNFSNDLNGFPTPSIDEFEWFLGVGFTVAEWTIDCELEHQTPFSVGYWLTGYSYWEQDESSGPVARISAVYNY